MLPAPPQLDTLRRQLRHYLIRHPVSDLPAVVDALHARATNAPLPSSHAIVVLGVPVNPDGTPSPGLRARVQRAFEVAQQDPNAILIVTGNAVANQYSEAECMSQLLLDLGIPPQRIHLERYATTTLDNAAFVFEILRSLWPEQGPSQLTVVSEPYHAPRSLRHFAAARTVFFQDRDPPTLFLAASEPAQVAVLMRHQKAVVIGRRIMNPGIQALLMRCVEEKRRIAVGW